jgi:hypothetical protein
LEYAGVHVRKTLKWSLKKWDGGNDWIDLAQERDTWWAVVNTEMNFRFAQNAGKFFRS